MPAGNKLFRGRGWSEWENKRTAGLGSQSDVIFYRCFLFLRGTPFLGLVLREHKRTAALAFWGSPIPNSLYLRIDQIIDSEHIVLTFLQHPVFDVRAKF